MHQQTMQQVVRGEMRLKVSCLSHENTRDKCLRVENIPRSEMFEIGANAATNDTASCARSNVLENVRCRTRVALSPENPRQIASEMVQPEASQMSEGRKYTENRHVWDRQRCIYKCLRGNEIPKSDMFAIDADASNDAASCARYDAAETEEQRPTRLR